MSVGELRPLGDFMADVHRGFEEYAQRSIFIEAIASAQTTSDRFEAILAYYRALWPVVERTPTNQWATEPYEVDWLRYFSPIESLLWGDIRQEGVVLYPQHPVAGYFVDFGHPVPKVAIECDGRRWHQDKGRDARRQAAIEAKGWTVYRLTGSQCVKHGGERYDENRDNWFYEAGPAQRLVREIGRQHGLR